jgi:hypothetical protein
MKKTARYFLVLLALSGVASTAFAGVGGPTNPTGNRIITTGK